jgi:hypothetical protein
MDEWNELNHSDDDEIVDDRFRRPTRCVCASIYVGHMVGIMMTYMQTCVGVMTSCMGMMVVVCVHELNDKQKR